MANYAKPKSERASFPLPEIGQPVPLGEFLAAGDTRFSAVYFLFDRGQVVYIGQSKTLRWRIEQHLTDRVKRFDTVAFARCPVNRLTYVESSYIREYAPRYNSCAVSLKARQRLEWAAVRNRERLTKANHASALPSAELEFVDAAECLIAPDELGEFLGIAESEAAALHKSGRIHNMSVLGLIMFTAMNSREVASAQGRYDRL